MKKRRTSRPPREATPRVAETYSHYDATSPMRPEVGTQPQFRKSGGTSCSS